jgi:transglutaminase-like putative cysteine protease
MRTKLRHRIQFSFSDPARNLIQTLRLTPRSHEGQRISNWRIEVEPDCLLKAGEDHFGNITHTLSIQGPVSGIRILAQGQISTYDAVGLVRGSAERLPPDIFLRSTPATAQTSHLRAFATEACAGTGDPIARLHDLMGAIHASAHASGEAPLASPEDSSDGTGKPEQLAHTMIACARLQGWPARCVTGFLVPDEGDSRRHAWAEILVEGLGWVGFDPLNDVCPQDCHVRTAIGLDATDAAAVRGTRLDGMSDSVEVTRLIGRADAADAPRTSQRQTSGN